MDNGSQHALTIERLSQGGFVVTDAYRRSGELYEMYLACTTVDEALKFIRDKITPIPAIKEPGEG